MQILDVSTLKWQVMGWRPFHWRLRWSMELGSELKSDCGPVPAAVPGSVQRALLDSGHLGDWNVGLQSRSAEWVEHRHWEFITEIPAGLIPAGQPVTLHAEGLDYSGWILIDSKEVGAFAGTLTPHDFDLTSALGDGATHHLSIVFDEPPTEQGQIGYTSWSKFYKPRFSYSWDWCPRLVPIGIWDALTFQIGRPTFHVESLRAELDSDLRTGRIRLQLSRDISVATADVTVRVSRNGKTVLTEHVNLSSPTKNVEYSIANVDAWWPNGHGDQPMYDIAIGDASHTDARRIGFRRFEWKPCEGASADATPWICVVNGKPIFLQGVNWTPVMMDFASATIDDYRKLIDLYRDMGCNLLRVWGGAYLEKEMFYSLCDDAGLMIWQEFPLSSSGVDNWAPEDPQSVATLCDIAKSYIKRRGHHASKLMWCGGNELQHEAGKKTGCGIPIDNSHPCIAALKRIVEEFDPGVRFVPTSSSGPKFMADAKDFGKGLHHDVHGPWNLDGTLDDWRAYWEKDDALFRSETGAPGASQMSQVDRYRGDANPWPPSIENPYWRHANSWWIQWDRFSAQLTDGDERQRYAKFIELSQQLQADALRIAASSCKNRFPRCGGFLVWMGHDAWPCVSNTAVIDFDRNIKPAYTALKQVFTAK